MALDLDDGDWIPVWRKIRKSWLWKDPEALRAWIDLIMLANHHDGNFRFRGALHPMKRGQVATTFLSLAKRNGWSRDRVKSFLRMLEQAESVTFTHRSFDTSTNTWSDTKSDTGFILLTIVNYPLRKVGQHLPTAESAAESAGIRQGETLEDRQELDSNPTATRQRFDTSKKGKKEKKGKKGGGEAPPIEAAPAPDPTPTPPSGPSAGTDPSGPESAGNQPVQPSPPAAPQPEQVTGRPEDIADSYIKGDKTVPKANALNHVCNAIERGADPKKFHAKVIELRGRMKLWTIGDLVVDGNGTAKPLAEQAAVVVARRNGDMDRHEKAVDEVESKLAALPPEEVAALRQEAEQEAAQKKVPMFGLEGFIRSWLRARVARKFGIQGV